MKNCVFVISIASNTVNNCESLYGAYMSGQMNELPGERFITFPIQIISNLDNQTIDDLYSFM